MLRTMNVMPSLLLLSADWIESAFVELRMCYERNRDVTSLRKGRTDSREAH